MRAEQLIELILLLLIIVLPAMLQAFGKLRQQAKPPQPGAPKPPRQPQKRLEDEIGEFLRRAAEGRRGPSAPPPKRSPQRTAQAPFRPLAPPKPVEAEVVPEPVGDEIGRHVKKYIDTGDFQRRSAELGERVASADQAMGQHLQGVFAHDVGQLSRPPGEAGGLSSSAVSAAAASDAVSPLAGSVLRALSQPENVRQAIIINEILRRPEERW